MVTEVVMHQQNRLELTQNTLELTQNTLEHALKILTNMF